MIAKYKYPYIVGNLFLQNIKTQDLFLNLGTRDFLSRHNANDRCCDERAGRKLRYISL
jgi:hypothetical protein